jgi:PiT family inorganic phosphate transporter
VLLMTEVGILLVATVLAYANGANDVSKGIATLVGSGVADYRRAILWGTLWTGVGGLAASVVAGAMLTTFGQGIVASGVAPSLGGAMSALAGATAWVLIATRLSLPVSTTHALVGALVGATVAAHGAAGVAWPALGNRVVLPLLASPLAAFVLARFALARLTPRGPNGTAAADCLCVESAPLAVALGPAGEGALLASASVPGLDVVTGSTPECGASRPQALRLTADHVHWLSSGTVSFARGLNDAPKIVALALGALALAPASATTAPGVLFACITAGMVGGSALAGRRVTRVLAEDVTPMDHWQGLTANVVTTTLVTTGAVYGLPMSTTHVSSGGIAAIGARQGSLERRTVRNIAAAWVVTLPAAALLAAGAYALIRAISG